MYNFINKAGQQVNVPMVSEEAVVQATRQSSTDLKETNWCADSDFEFIRIDHNTWFEFEKLWTDEELLNTIITNLDRLVVSAAVWNKDKGNKK